MRELEGSERSLGEKKMSRKILSRGSSKEVEPILSLSLEAYTHI